MACLMKIKAALGKHDRCIVAAARGMGFGMKAAAAIAALFATGFAAVPAASARTSLGTFERWGAFRDDAPVRCFAIAEPVRQGGGRWRSFASVATWPGAGVRGQLHIRLAREKLSAAPVRLSVGGRRFMLVASGADAWAPDARTDAAIVAAMRSAPAMTVSTRAVTGATFSETYGLKGAATALDAAALGCARG